MTITGDAFDSEAARSGEDGGPRGAPAASARVPVDGRLLAAGIALGCLAALLLATQLVPSPDGYGSHTGYPLRLEPCAFMERTGLPCPSCGMTTSFCWFVRGNLLASVYVQPMGALLAALAGCCVWFGFYIAITGRPAHRLLALIPGRYWGVGLLAAALLGWVWKIFIHLHGLDGWG